jgi:hypothetical protein
LYVPSKSCSPEGRQKSTAEPGWIISIKVFRSSCCLISLNVGACSTQSVMFKYRQWGGEVTDTDDDSPYGILTSDEVPDSMSM